MSHQPTIDLLSIPISCQFSTNQPIMIHALIHTKVINSSPYNRITHAYSHTSCFK